MGSSKLVCVFTVFFTDTSLFTVKSTKYCDRNLCSLRNQVLTFMTKALSKTRILLADFSNLI